METLSQGMTHRAACSSVADPNPEEVGGKGECSRESAWERLAGILERQAKQMSGRTKELPGPFRDVIGAETAQGGLRRPSEGQVESAAQPARDGSL